MYGLKKEQPKELFAFDLEKEIKAKPAHGKQLLDKADHRILEIKQQLREGVDSSQFEPLGALLHAYGALQRVIKKVMK